MFPSAQSENGASRRPPHPRGDSDLAEAPFVVLVTVAYVARELRREGNRLGPEERGRTCHDARRRRRDSHSRARVSDDEALGAKEQLERTRRRRYVLRLSVASERAAPADDPESDPRVIELSNQTRARRDEANITCRDPREHGDRRRTYQRSVFADVNG